MYDTNAQNLQAKINALKRSVTRIILIFPAEIVQDVSGCIEQLQTLDRSSIFIVAERFIQTTKWFGRKGRRRNELLLRLQVSYSCSLEIQLSF